MLWRSPRNSTEFLEDEFYDLSVKVFCSYQSNSSLNSVMFLEDSIAIWNQFVQEVNGISIKAVSICFTYRGELGEFTI